MYDPDISIELKEFLRRLNSYGQGKPIIINVDSSMFNIDLIGDKKYQICSACYQFIDQTWDHEDWCELYEEEAVVKWINSKK